MVGLAGYLLVARLTETRMRSNEAEFYAKGGFRPWYELPLLQSFGGLGTLLVALQYLAGVWERDSF